MVRMNLNELNAELTKEELKELQAAELLGNTSDNECPEMTADVAELESMFHQSIENYIEMRREL